MPNRHYSDLELAIQAKDFIATVTITGSRDARETTWLGTYTVLDLSGQKLGRSTELHLPESDFPVLHFRMTGHLTPSNIQGLSVAGSTTVPWSYQVVAGSSHILEKGRDSVVEFTVPPHVPIDRIEFSPPATPVSFSRKVSVRIDPARLAANRGDGGVRPLLSFAGSLLRLHSMQAGHRLDENVFPSIRRERTSWSR